MKKKRFTEEQVIEILRQAERGEQTIGEVCRAHGVLEQPVGRESVAHPAFSIIPTIDLARYHLPRIQDYKYPFHVFRSRVSVDVPAA